MSQRRRVLRTEIEIQRDNLQDQIDALQGQIDRLDTDLAWAIDQLPCWVDPADLISSRDRVVLTNPLPY